MKRLLVTLTLGLLLGSAAVCQDRATAPYEMTFENELYFDEIPEWEQSGFGRTEISTGGACEGLKTVKIWADIVMNGGMGTTINDATLKLNLSEGQEYLLVFNWKASFKASNNIGDACKNVYEFYQVSYIQERNEEGIYISDDEGMNYIKIADWGHRYDEWDSQTINLSSMARQKGLVLNNTFRIKFQYHCVYGTELPTSCFYERYLELDKVSLSAISSGDTGGDLGYKVVYDYDQAGNRTGRQYVEIPLANKSARINAPDPEPFVDQVGEKAIQIYPNPTRGNLKINIVGSDEDVNYRFGLYDMQGRELLKGAMSEYGEYPIEMGYLNSGVYMLILQSAEEKLTYKIIKE